MKRLDCGHESQLCDVYPDDGGPMRRETLPCAACADMKTITVPGHDGNPVTAKRIHTPEFGWTWAVELEGV